MPTRNQPGIAQWNLTRLTECLLPLLSDSEEDALTLGRDVLGGFAPTFHAAHLGGFRAKLGLAAEGDDDLALLQDLLDRMAASKADFTLTFRRLCDAADDAGARPRRPRPVHRSDGLRRLGRALALAPRPRDPSRPDPPSRDAGRQPSLHRAEPPGRGSDRGGHRARSTTRPSRRSAACSRPLRRPA